MVQYRNRNTLFYKQFWFDNYWMLDPGLGMSGADAKASLKENGFFCGKSTKKARLIDLYCRMQRSLLPYDACTFPELQGFMEERGIIIDSETQSKKSSLVDSLEAADDLDKFQRFMELPPELRVRIYCMHYETWSTLEIGVHQPPISLVSSQIRCESLPLFYSTCTFSLEMYSRGVAMATSSLSAFMKSATPQNKSRVKNISLMIMNDELRYIRGSWLVNATDHARKSGHQIITRHKVLTETEWRGGEKWVRDIEQAIEDTVRSNQIILLDALIELLPAVIAGK